MLEEESKDISSALMTIATSKVRILGEPKPPRPGNLIETRERAGCGLKTEVRKEGVLGKNAAGTAILRKKRLGTLFGPLIFCLAVAHPAVKSVFAGAFRVFRYHFFDCLAWRLRLLSICGHVV
jgi:hypothetical protein